MRTCGPQFCCCVSSELPGLATAKEHGAKEKGEGKKEQFHNNKFQLIAIREDLWQIRSQEYFINEYAKGGSQQTTGCGQ